MPLPKTKGNANSNTDVNVLNDIFFFFLHFATIIINQFLFVIKKKEFFFHVRMNKFCHRIKFFCCLFAFRILSMNIICMYILHNSFHLFSLIHIWNNYMREYPHSYSFAIVTKKRMLTI